MDEIVKDFLIESNENLDRLDQELVKLESDPSSKELLASVFRTIHTIKGSCGFLGFARLEKLAHAGESLLSRLRDGQLSLSAEITSGLLAMVDAVRQMLAAIQASEQDGEEDYAPLIELLGRLQSQPTSESPTANGVTLKSSRLRRYPPQKRKKLLRRRRSPRPPIPHPRASPDENLSVPKPRTQPTPCRSRVVLCCPVMLRLRRSTKKPTRTAAREFLKREQPILKSLRRHRRCQTPEIPRRQLTPSALESLCSTGS